jgi:hypothetical protein
MKIFAFGVMAYFAASGQVVAAGDDGLDRNPLWTPALRLQDGEVVEAPLDEGSWSGVIWRNGHPVTPRVGCGVDLGAARSSRVTQNRPVMRRQRPRADGCDDLLTKSQKSLQHMHRTQGFREN